MGRRELILNFKFSSNLVLYLFICLDDGEVGPLGGGGWEV